MPKRRHPNIGSTLQSLFVETGELWEVHLHAQKKLLAMKFQQRMRTLHMKKSKLAEKTATSRSQVDKCLDPDDIGMTLSSMARTAAALGLDWSFSFKETRARK